MNLRFIFPVLFLAVSGLAAAARADDSVTVGLRKQLLVDDFVVAERANLTRVLGEARKENGGQPVMRPDRPWEDPWHFGLYLTAMHRDGKFKLWYNAWQNAFGYAESENGLDWRRPNLGLYDFQLEQAQAMGFRGDAKGFSGRQNNIVLTDCHGFSLSFDPHETDSSHRYKAAHGRTRVTMASLAHSPDGIRWTAYSDGEPVTGRASDTHNQVLWDEEAQLYRLYTRTDYRIGDIKDVRGNRVMVNSDLNADPKNWTTVREWRFDREGPEEHLRRQIYSLTNWIYEGVHFALMTVYEWPDVKRTLRTKDAIPDYETRHEKDVVNFYIGTSRDGANWDLDWVYAGRPLVERGPAGSYDKDGIWPASTFVTYNDRHWIFYGGMNERHNILRRQLAIGLATLRLDGFVGLQAGSESGTLVTKPFVLEGSRLELNVEAPEGELEVEVLDSAGRPMPLFRQSLARVDDLRLKPEWAGPASLEALKGKMVRLRFKLRNARLYAFHVRP